MTIDTHAHLNFNAYKDDADEVIRRSLDNNVWMINVGSTYETSKRAVRIAEKYDAGVYAAIGLHPIHLAEGIFKAKLDTEEISFQAKEEEFDYSKYKDLAQSKKVVAVGEIGFDYYYRPKTRLKLEEFKKKQRETFLKQLDLAKELNLPVIFHCRMANEELIEILKQCHGEIKGVIHCFFGSWQQAEKYLEMGFYLGFNGIIFKLNLDETIEKAPLGRILIETDCPYLTPPPITGRNEPIYARYVVERIAKIKKLNLDKVAEITTENAKKVFNI
ncbi:MAG: TatD family deoxyribonuclease [Candidatus Nealsonbacteria bacterium]|nr:TatD family deoxyribonuclease [Candidatus Nealsonbacteria bacterium]